MYLIRNFDISLGCNYLIDLKYHPNISTENLSVRGANLLNLSFITKQSYFLHEFFQPSSILFNLSIFERRILLCYFPICLTFLVKWIYLFNWHCLMTFHEVFQTFVFYANQVSVCEYQWCSLNNDGFQLSVVDLDLACILLTFLGNGDCEWFWANQSCIPFSFYLLLSLDKYWPYPN